MIKIVSIIQCLFFSILILTTKNENPKAQKFLVLFLLAFALLEADEMFFYSRYVFQIPHWTGLVDPLAYCLGPLIYFYTSSLTDRCFSFSKQHLYYFLPAFVMYLLWIPVYFKSSAYKTDHLLEIFGQQAGMPVDSYLHKLFLANMYLVILSGLLFLCLSLYKVYRFNLSIRQLYSSVDFINLKWLKFLLILSSFIWLSFLVSNFSSSPILNKIDFIIFPLFIFLISYYDLRQKRIPHINEAEAEKEIAAPGNRIVTSRTLAEEPVKYARSGIDNKMMSALSDKLIYLVEQKKVYTKNDLSLQELADMMETSTHKLSQLLNEKMNQSFYDFINFHRVQEVKSKLASEEYSHLKVLAIAFDAGFNSKTTFNAAFKKQVGLSPTDYRKSIKSA